MKLTSLIVSGLLLVFGAENGFGQSADSTRISDDFGFRAGASLDPGVSDAKPTLDAYYEVPFGNLLLAGDLQFLFVSPEAIGIHLFTGAGDPVLESYGFHGVLRTLFRLQRPDGSFYGWRPFVGVGMGFDVYALYENRVSASFPVISGALFPIGNKMELELAARVAPLFFFGKEPGIAYGLTAGIRFSN